MKTCLTAIALLSVLAAPILAHAEGGAEALQRHHALTQASYLKQAESDASAGQRSEGKQQEVTREQAKHKDRTHS